MLLRSPARRWLSADVQPDLVLTCDDGRVPAHAALLASSSTFLSALLSAPSSLHCAGCSSPRSLLLSGVKVAEARALVELLYTGKAPYTRDVASLLGLCDMLGLELDALDVMNRGMNTVTSQLSLRVGSDDISDKTDGVHRRFNRDHASCESIPGCDEDLEPVRNNQTTSKLSVITSGLKSMFSASQSKISNHLPESSSSLSLKRGERLSKDLAAEPLHSFPLKKLPCKSPEVRDNILAEEHIASVQLKTPPKRPVQNPPRPDCSPGQVMVPNSVLSEVMQMLPVEAIKIEVDTERSEVEEAEYPQMEGREEDDEAKEKAVGEKVTSYMSMNNSRNFVCEKCDAGFTFVRSYRWHLARCTKGAKGERSNIPSQSKAAPVPVIVCKICNASVTGLKSHLSLVHFKSQLLEKFSSSPRKCNICNKSFKSIHSLILHIGIHHGMVKKLSQSSNPILKRKMLTAGKQSQPSNSKEPDKSSSSASAADIKDKNSLYKASLMKKKLSSNNSLVSNNTGKNNSLYRASQMNKLMSKSPSQNVSSTKASTNDITPKSPVKKSPLKKTADSKIVANVSIPGPRREACGQCVKCLLPDCGECAQCAGGGAPGLQRLCVKKVCRNKIWTTNNI